MTKPSHFYLNRKSFFSFSYWFSVVFFTGFLGVLVFFPAAGWTQTGKGTPPGISDSVLSQLRVLQEEKRGRTSAQRKLGSQLVQAIKYRQGDPKLRAMPRMKTNVVVGPDETALVDIKARVTPGLLNRIEQLGGTVINAFAEYESVRASVSLDTVEQLAKRAEVHHVRPASRAYLKKLTITEGDVAHSAAAARTEYSLTGKNIRTDLPVKVGVLSDSVDWLSSVQSLGDLPAVTVLEDAPGNTGEGTAMLEIIHDLAPDAQLYFATGWNGKASFANNIKALADAGCKIIVDDLGYLDESPFQDDIISRAINSVTSQGVFYFSAAGNEGNLKKGTSSVWEGDYNGQAAIVAGSFLSSVHNFGGGDWANRIVSDTGCYTLFWSDPLGASGSDYDLYLIDPSLNQIVGESSGFQTGTQDPVEGFCITEDVDATNYNLVVVKYSGQTRFLHLSANGGRLEYNTDGQIFGHPAAENAFAVSSVNAAGRTIPFLGTEQVEWYSSDGPRRIFYYPNGTAITPGNLLSTGGMVRNKPDISAADCVATSTPGFSIFCGSSAAAPHAAGIAALMLSGKPDLTIKEVRQIFTVSSLDIESPGWDKNSGYGIVMADNVLESLRPFARINPAIRYLLLNGR